MIMGSIDPGTHLTDYVDTTIYAPPESELQGAFELCSKSQEDLLQVNTEIQEQERVPGMSFLGRIRLTFEFLFNVGEPSIGSKCGVV